MYSAHFYAATRVSASSLASFWAHRRIVSWIQLKSGAATIILFRFFGQQHRQYWNSR